MARTSKIIYYLIIAPQATLLSPRLKTIFFGNGNDGASFGDKLCHSGWKYFLNDLFGNSNQIK